MGLWGEPPGRKPGHSQLPCSRAGHERGQRPPCTPTHHLSGRWPLAQGEGPHHSHSRPGAQPLLFTWAALRLGKGKGLGHGHSESQWRGDLELVLGPQRRAGPASRMGSGGRWSRIGRPAGNQPYPPTVPTSTPALPPTGPARPLTLQVQPGSWPRLCPPRPYLRSPASGPLGTVSHARPGNHARPGPGAAGLGLAEAGGCGFRRPAAPRECGSPAGDFPGVLWGRSGAAGQAGALARGLGS